MNNIDLYYKSLNKIKEAIKKEGELNKKSPIEKILFFLNNVFTFVLVFSIIPVFPLFLIWLFYLQATSFWIFNFGILVLSDIVFIWLIITVFFGILTGVFSYVQSKTIKKSLKKKSTLSLTSDQTTFISIYQAYKELELYLVTNIDKHVENAIEAFSLISHRFISTDISQTFRNKNFIYDDNLSEFEYPNIEKPRLIRSLPTPDIVYRIRIAQSFLNTYGDLQWFHIDNKTRDILNALVSLQSKIKPRLSKRKDLSNVFVILEDFSKFLYAFLPSHETNHEENDLRSLHKLGENHLESFVQKLNELSEYPLPKIPESTKKEIIKPHIINRLKHIYTKSLFFRFLFWLIFMLLITSMALYIVNSIYTIENGHMPTFIIGIVTASMASAAALSGFSNRTKREEDIE